MIDSEDTPPTEKEAAPRSPSEQVRHWLAEIKRAERSTETWRQRGDKIIKRYRDERETDNPERAHRMALLWSNVETLRPAVYARTPKPNVQRRNKDKDPLGRAAAMVLERALDYCLTSYDFDGLMWTVVGDFLLTARGVAWVRYEPVMSGDDVSWQKAGIEYVNRHDFLHNPARTWDEVWWVAKRNYLTRAELVQQFGKDGQTVELDAKLPEEQAEKDDEREHFSKATVWTIWSKRDRMVYMIAPGMKEKPLREMPPPVNYDDFFPCPRPMLGTRASDSMIPTPDFVLYQDQADEIDELTQRIALLAKALKLRGVYDAELGPQFARLMNDSDQNELIPVDKWALFGEKGGFKGVMEFMPLKDVADALTQCYMAREQAKAVLYEVTGIGDVVRGASNPNETATAQSIKSQWGSIRIRDRQREVQRFARDLIRLKSEIIAEHFGPQVLQQMTGVNLPTGEQKAQAQMAAQRIEQQAKMQQQMGQPAPPPQIPEHIKKILATPSWDEVIALLRDERLRGYLIDVQSDSMVEPDQTEEREARVQFTQSVTAFLQAAGEILPAAPMLAPLMGELLTFAVRGFKVGDELEDDIEEAMKAVEQALSQPKPDPNAESEKLKAETAKVKAGAETEKAKAAVIGAQADVAKTQMEMQMMPMKADLERQKIIQGQQRAMAPVITPQ